MTPSKSPSVLSSAEPSGGVLRPSSQAPGAWQRRHSSPDAVASWLAIASAAWNTGSRVACAIMLDAQRVYGSWSTSKLPWQTAQFGDDWIDWFSVSGCVPGCRKSFGVVAMGRPVVRLVEERPREAARSAAPAIRAARVVAGRFVMGVRRRAGGERRARAGARRKRPEKMLPQGSAPVKAANAAIAGFARPDPRSFPDLARSPSAAHQEEGRAALRAG